MGKVHFASSTVIPMDSFARSLGTCVLFPDPFAGPRQCTGFPHSDPMPCLTAGGPRRFWIGVSPTYLPPSFTSLQVSRVHTEDSNKMV